MKKISFILLSIALFVFVGCGEEFLDRPSKTQMDDGNFWSSEQNLRLFVNGAYENYFNGYANSWGQQYAPGVYSSGEMSDDARTVAGQLTNFITAVPDDNWYRTDDKESGYNGTYWLYRTGAGPWNFGFIRKWNLMIERLNTMKEEGILPDSSAASSITVSWVRSAMSRGTTTWWLPPIWPTSTRTATAVSKL